MEQLFFSEIHNMGIATNKSFFNYAQILYESSVADV